MIYEITHLTRYRYGGPVAANACSLRLYPHDGDGQKVISAQLDVTPKPQDWGERVDPFENRVARMRIDTQHRELTIVARSRVKVERPAAPIAALTPPWEAIAALAAETGSLAATSPAFAIYPSRMIEIFEDATAYARKSFAAGRPIYEAALDLNKRIKADFAYDSKATEVSTTPAEAFKAKRGVCQDFAHVMIAGLRGLGLPAATSAQFLRLENLASPAPTPRTPGSASGAVRPLVGGASIPPTPSPKATTISSSRMAATTPMCLRSMG